MCRLKEPTCGAILPPQNPCPHKGYLQLHVLFESHELLFSAPAQLEHFIDVLSSKPLPTSRQLSSRRGLPVGPNGHWLSRLQARLKSPQKRGGTCSHVVCLYGTSKRFWGIRFAGTSGFRRARFFSEGELTYTMGRVPEMPQSGHLEIFGASMHIRPLPRKIVDYAMIT